MSDSDHQLDPLLKALVVKLDSPDPSIHPSIHPSIRPLIEGQICGSDKAAFNNLYGKTRENLVTINSKKRKQTTDIDLALN